jgi:hypothetical protein
MARPIGHFFSFRCPLVNTPQLNTQPNSTTELTSEVSSDLIKLKIRVKFTLRLAVYRSSVPLGIRPFATNDQNLFQLNT